MIQTTEDYAAALLADARAIAQRTGTVMGRKPPSTGHNAQSGSGRKPDPASATSMVMAAVRDGCLTTTDITAHTGLGRDTVKDRIGLLVAQGRLVRRRSGNDRWVEVAG